MPPFLTSPRFLCDIKSSLEKGKDANKKFQTSQR